MKINSINYFAYPNYKHAFIKPSMPANNVDFRGKAKLEPDAFFYKLNGYTQYNEKDEKTYSWAVKMNILAEDTANLISRKENFDKILDLVELRIACINNNPLYYGERDRKGEKTRYDMPDFGRGSDYFKKYYEKFDDIVENFCFIKKAKSNEEYKDANTATIISSPYSGMFIEYGRSERTNLDLVKKEYEKLISNDSPTLDEINKSCATIQWLIAQETPYLRGSDSIANILARSIYLAYDVQTTPPKNNVGLDFEAWGCDLDEYIELYPNLFRERPKFCKEE